MNIIEFLRANVVDDTRFTRFNEFDPVRFDYTLQVQLPSGDKITLRNPKEEKDGTLIDKSHTVPAGSVLLAAGTAFWKWSARKQHSVGIDIDADDNHAAGLESAKLEEALDAAQRVPWWEVRRSSGGKGLHVFPQFSQPVDVATRAEASALAHAVLTLASREAAFDFKAAKDCAGGNMWIFKADAPPTAYEVIKPATQSLDPDALPPGWRLVPQARKQKIDFAPSTVPLCPEHLKVEGHIKDIGTTIWVPDVGCYHVHTYALQQASREHEYRGFFATESAGTELSKPNAYMFPLPGGGFLVKRFGDAREHSSWFDGPNGQYALLDVEASFDKAVAQFSTNKTTKGHAFTRDNLLAMLRATGVDMPIPESFSERTFFVKAAKDEVQIAVERLDSDAAVEDWTSTGGQWQRSYRMPLTPPAFGEAAVIRGSAIVRAVSTDTESSKWCINTDGVWVGTTAGEVGNVLDSINAWPTKTMGRMRQKPYWLVFEPFQPEYLSRRRWNHEAPQLACQPADVADDTPTWDAVFDHLGGGLDDDVAADEVCQSRGIASGAHYLKLWTKLLIEKPQQRTPYLFLTSRQNNTGKTSLGASICHLINPGVAEINEEALVDKFTGELEGKVLCLIEELDLRDKRNKAYSTLKRVLTSKTLTIRRMRTDAYNVPNFTHFIHTANDANFVPCETEDMRIIMINVPPITTLIESLKFEEGIKREAPSMLRKLLDIPLVEPCGRFWLPVVQTSLKESVLTGLYDNETSEAEEGLKKFAHACIAKATDGMAPTSSVLSRYVTFCRDKGLPPVPKMAFLKTLRDKCDYSFVDKKQKRIDGKQVWHYTGLLLKG